MRDVPSPAVVELAALKCCFYHTCFDRFFTTSAPQVRHLYICDFHKNFIQSVRNKRKRKTSDDGGDSPEHETDVPEVSRCRVGVGCFTNFEHVNVSLGCFHVSENTYILNGNST